MERLPRLEPGRSARRRSVSAKGGIVSQERRGVERLARCPGISGGKKHTFEGQTGTTFEI